MIDQFETQFLGDAPLFLGLMRGDIQAAIVPTSTGREHTKSGDLRALGVYGLQTEVEWDDLDAESDGIVALQDDVVFLPVYDEANVYEMPEMLDDMIADLSGAKVDTWVGPDFSPQRDEPDKRWIYIVRTSTTGIPWERAIVGFFTRDYRFESWWEHPALHTQRVLNLGVTTILEPDFSTMAEQPLIVAMWQTYRQRWLARYFQEAGLTDRKSVV